MDNPPLDARPASPFQNGQQWMRQRIADVLRGEHPDLAVLVEKLPLHGEPTVDAVIDAAIENTREARARELDAERVDSDTMNFRMGARPDPQQVRESWTQQAHEIAKMAQGIVHRTLKCRELLSRVNAHRVMRDFGRDDLYLELMTDRKIAAAIEELHGVSERFERLEALLASSAPEPTNDHEAARSAATFVIGHAVRQRHTEAVADCPHCNMTFLASWVLERLGPEPTRAMPPGPPDPPRPRAKIV